MIEAQTKGTPLGVIDSLSSGFSLVAQRPLLLIIPVLLDLFLWLGPRLSLSPIASSLAARLLATTSGATDSSAIIFEQNTVEILSSYNLFSALSTWPLGIPSLLAGNDAGAGPMGSPRAILVQTPETLFLWLVGLVLSGLLMGSLYLSLVARGVGGDQNHGSAWGRRFWIGWARILGFVVLVLVGAFLVSVPFFLAVEIVAAFLTPLTSLALLAGVAMGMWGLFHLFFAPHGILLYDANLRVAIRASISLVRKHRLSSAGLLLMAVFINLGLGIIWNIPGSESWIRVIAIAGNAFINTGVAAATFVFFRERTSA